MPLEFPTDPQHGAGKVPPDFTKLMPSRSGLSLFRREQEPRLDDSRPHKVYTVGLDDLIAGKLLSAAKLIAWRYFVLDASGNVIGGTEFQPAPRTPETSPAILTPRFTTRGPLTEATAAAIQTAETLEDVQEQAYEVRLLQITAVYFIGLWLHGVSRDLIVPIGNTPQGLEPNKPYSEAEIIGVLQPIARRNKDFNS